MADRVILHIGPRKTGTTYIQKTLWDNRDRLGAQGFWLPLESTQQQFEAVSRGRPGWWANGRADELWAELCDEVRSRDGVAVISTELFSAARAVELEEMVDALGPVRVDVVFGVRSLSRSIPSEWQQWVRARSTLSYAEWLATLRDDPTHGFWITQDPGRIIARWSKLVPEERINAVIVPTSAHDPHELWARFSAAAGLDPAGFEVPIENVNESIGVVQAELLRRVNERVDPELTKADYGRTVRDNLTSGVLRGVENARKVVLPAAHYDWVEQRSTELAAVLEQSAIGVHGDLADLHVPPVAPDADPMTVSEAELVDAAVSAILGLVDQAAERDRQVRRLRRRKMPGSGLPGHGS